MDTLRLVAFSRPLGLIAAIRNGYFEAEQLRVDYTPARGSRHQIRGLLAGDWDIAHTAVDNVAAYVDAENADLFVFLVGDLGTNQRLIVRPPTASFQELHGKTLGLDALTTGYAFMLYEMLARHGLGRADYRTVSVGGTAERLTALLQGDIDAALLSPPHDELALAAGCRALAAASADFAGYPGLCAAARRNWAGQHRTIVVRYCRALLAGIRWAADRANRQAVITQLAEDHGCELPAATRLYQREMDQQERVVPSLEEIREAIRGVIALRREMTGAHLEPGIPVELSRYFDPFYLLEADPRLQRPTGTP